MSFILNIHTATEIAMISIAENETVIAFSMNTNQIDHASFLQPAIKLLLSDCDLKLKQLNAVAVTAGPGSYTGLRVGMASTKGLCYALKIPLITLSTLEVMALSVIDTSSKNKEKTFFCPMLDARRMEIFTAVYDDQLNQILSPCAMQVTSKSMEELLQNNKILFFGNGAIKAQNLIINTNALFINAEINREAIAKLSYKKFLQAEFADLSYSEPLYIKEFHTILNPL